jgi:hypothetical protein
MNWLPIIGMSNLCPIWFGPAPASTHDPAKGKSAEPSQIRLAIFHRALEEKSSAGTKKSRSYSNQDGSAQSCPERASN